MKAEHFMFGFAWWGIVDLVKFAIDQRTKDAGKYLRESLARVPKKYRREVAQVVLKQCADYRRIKSKRVAL